MSTPANRSIPELFSDAFAQLAKLVGNEFELARAELSQKVSQVGRAAILMSAGALIFLPALMLILFGVAALLIQNGFSPPASYFITGIGAAIIAGGLIWIGVSRLSGDALKPKETIDQLQRDKIAAREMVG